MISKQYTHKELQKLEDPLVCEDVQSVSCDWIDHWQTMDLIFDEWVNRIKYTGRKQLRVTRNQTFQKCSAVTVVESSYIAEFISRYIWDNVPINQRVDKASRTEEDKHNLQKYDSPCIWRYVD